jgi:hypothetical protein
MQFSTWSGRQPRSMTDCQGSTLGCDELKQLALRTLIQRHLGLPTTHRVQIFVARYLVIAPDKWRVF